MDRNSFKKFLTTEMKIGDANFGSRHELHYYSAVPTYAIEFSDYF